MKKSLRILLFSFICFFAISSRCLAVNIDMNLGSDNVSSLSNNVSVSSNIIGSGTTNDFLDNNLNSNITDDDYDQFGDEDYTAAANTISSRNTVSSTTSSSNIADRLQSLPESELGLTNILNILLIAVGVVLILLAIAIFIRLKK